MIDNKNNVSPALYAETSGNGNALTAVTYGNSPCTPPSMDCLPPRDGNALTAITYGTGMAGYFEKNNPDDSWPALGAISYGPGDAVGSLVLGTHGNAASFSIENPNNDSSALDANSNGAGKAIRGEMTGTGLAALFKINNPNNSLPALVVQTNGTGSAGDFTGDVWIHSGPSPSFSTLSISNDNGSTYAGYFGGDVYITGNVSKHGGFFVQPHPTDPKKELVYAFFEGPEHAVFLRGTMKLIDGKATIETPEYFRVVAGDEEITVQFTPRSSKSRGLAAVEVTKETIVVEELMDGKGSYDFDYFITAKRAGFERHEPIQANTHFKADDMKKEDFEQRYSRTDDITSLAIRNLLISNGILTKEGKLNMETVEKLGWKVKESDVAKVGK